MLRANEKEMAYCSTQAAGNTKVNGQMDRNMAVE